MACFSTHLSMNNRNEHNGCFRPEAVIAVAFGLAGCQNDPK
jgi:hypothetical protein